MLKISSDPFSIFAGERALSRGNEMYRPFFCSLASAMLIAFSTTATNAATLTWRSEWSDWVSAKPRVDRRIRIYDFELSWLVHRAGRDPSG